MKRILLLLTVLLATLPLTAAPVDLATATVKAKQCETFQMRAHMGQVFSTPEPTLVLAEKGRKNPDQTVYYIFNTKQGFVIVAGDDRAQEILAIGDRPLDIDRMPENMKSWLQTYSEQIDYLLSNPDVEVEKPFKANIMLNAPSVEPLLTALWDQIDPYWDQCVFDNYQCLTGCPATSASMVFYYWKYPVAPTPVVPGFLCQLKNSYTGSITVNVPALPSVTFDWDNMLDSYLDGYTPEQGNAVATLMRYVGQAERMGYGTDEGGGSGISADSIQNIANTFLLFGYDTTVRHVKKNSAHYGGQVLFTDAEWAEMIQDELAEGRPIVYVAESAWGGHAFNVDGYNAPANLYHVNYGWSGNGNGYFALNAFKDGPAVYNEYQQMIIGIQPKYDGPAVLTSTTKISMESFTGESATQTFTVTGRGLTNNVTLTLEDENSVFATDVTTVSLSDSQGEGKEVTVTFSPQASGEYYATITLTSNNARKAVVRLIGTATMRKVDPVALDATEVGATSFRAAWTHETPASNVASYTLMVHQAGLEVAEEVASADFSSLNYTGLQGDAFEDFDSYCSPEGWTGNDIYPDRGSVRLGYSSDQPVGTLTTPALDLSHSGGKLTITFKAKGYGAATGNAILNIKTGSHTTSKSLTNTAKTYTVVLDCDEFIGETITFTSDIKRVSLTNITVTTTDLTSSGLRAPAEYGDAISRTITGITDRYYVVTGLAPSASYHYRVKAIYTDDTESQWSASRLVQLLSDEQPRGDINGDKSVNVADVTALIQIVLNSTPVDLAIADLDGNGTVNVADVTALITIVLNN